VVFVFNFADHLCKVPRGPSNASGSRSVRPTGPWGLPLAGSGIGRHLPVKQELSVAHCCSARIIHRGIGSGSRYPPRRLRHHRADWRRGHGPGVPSDGHEADARDAVYQRLTTITKLLNARARDKAKFALLFEELCNSGFRRNMCGMRWIGLSIAAITSIARGLKVVGLFASHSCLAVSSLAIEAVNLAMLAAWIFWVNETAVRQGSDLYAERLFETLDTVPVPV
jgi:hypothetical protein